MNIIPFKLEHLQALRLQPAQAGSAVIDPFHVERLGAAWTVLSEDQPIACAGVLEIWPDRGLAWALVGEDAGREFIALHRAVSNYLKQAPWKRVEAYVDAKFINGHRWVRILGFDREGYLSAFMQDGTDMVLYSRVRT